jgi:hypothetical protein
MNFARKHSRLISGAAVIIFLLYSWAGLRRGDAGKYHDRCVQFWNQKQWIALKTQAQNLSILEQADAETLFFGLLAAHHLNDGTTVQQLASKLLEKKALNHKIESNIAEIFIPTSLKGKIGIFRTRLLMAFWAGLAVCNLAGFVRRRPMNGWSSFLACGGILLLILS